MIRRNSAGDLAKSNDTSIEFKPADLPEPVVPAISR